MLTRREAKLLIKLKTTEKGKKFIKWIIPVIEDYCPDELVPVNWFIECYGKPSGKKFKKCIKKITSTFTEWPEAGGSPIKFTVNKMEKMKKEICESGALFGRKFSSKSAKRLGMSCKK